MLRKLRHEGLLDLTGLPEWSDFFRAATISNSLKFRWGEDDEGWWCVTYDFAKDLDRPIEIEVHSEANAAEKFEALRLAVEGCGREIKPLVWEAFFAFRAAANEPTNNIEDLL